MTHFARGLIRVRLSESSLAAAEATCTFTSATGKASEPDEVMLLHGDRDARTIELPWNFLHDTAVSRDAHLLGLRAEITGAGFCALNPHVPRDWQQQLLRMPWHVPIADSPEHREALWAWTNDTQKEAVNRLKDRYKKHMSATADCRTGFGKTDGLGITTILENRFRTLVVVPNLSVFAEWPSRLAARAPHLRVGTIQEGTFDVDGCDVVVASAPTLTEGTRCREKFRESTWIKSIGLVIVDEVHIGARRTNKILKMLPPCRKLGLSATPQQSRWRKAFRYIGGPVFFRGGTVTRPHATIFIYSHYKQVKRERDMMKAVLDGTLDPPKVEHYDRIRYRQITMADQYRTEKAVEMCRKVMEKFPPEARALALTDSVDHTEPIAKEFVKQMGEPYSIVNDTYFAHYDLWMKQFRPASALEYILHQMCPFHGCATGRVNPTGAVKKARKFREIVQKDGTVSKSKIVHKGCHCPEDLWLRNGERCCTEVYAGETCPMTNDSGACGCWGNSCLQAQKADLRASLLQQHGVGIVHGGIKDKMDGNLQKARSDIVGQSKIVSGMTPIMGTGVNMHNAYGIWYFHLRSAMEQSIGRIGRGRDIDTDNLHCVVVWDCDLVNSYAAALASWLKFNERGCCVTFVLAHGGPEDMVHHDLSQRRPPPTTQERRRQAIKTVEDMMEV
jgi:hypothetical protein